MFVLNLQQTLYQACIPS